MRILGHHTAGIWVGIRDLIEVGLGGILGAAEFYQASTGTDLRQ